MVGLSREFHRFHRFFQVVSIPPSDGSESTQCLQPQDRVGSDPFQMAERPSWLINRGPIRSPLKRYLGGIILQATLNRTWKPSI